MYLNTYTSQFGTIVLNSPWTEGLKRRLERAEVATMSDRKAREMFVAHEITPIKEKTAPLPLSHGVWIKTDPQGKLDYTFNQAPCSWNSHPGRVKPTGNTRRDVVRQWKNAYCVHFATSSGRLCHPASRTKATGKQYRWLRNPSRFAGNQQIRCEKAIKSAAEAKRSTEGQIDIQWIMETIQMVMVTHDIPSV